LHRAYIEGKPEASALFHEKQVAGFLSRLHDPNVAVRRGYSAALGALPSGLIQPVAMQVRALMNTNCMCTGRGEMWCFTFARKPEKKILARKFEAPPSVVYSEHLF
jgi:hypothetical protein